MIISLILRVMLQLLQKIWRSNYFQFNLFCYISMIFHKQISAAKYNAALLLKAKDHRGRPLLDVLIENEQVFCRLIHISGNIKNNMV